MNDRIRISDADRDRITAQLRDHFAEGRLTPDELDERVGATLNAKTFGDLRGVMADLPGPPPAPPKAQQPPRRPTPPWIFRRRGPRILPLILLALLAALLIPVGGGVFVALFKIVLVFWLAVCLAGILVAARFYRRMRRDWWPRYSQYQPRDWWPRYSGYQRPDWPGGHGHHRHRHSRCD